MHETGHYFGVSDDELDERGRIQREKKKVTKGKNKK